MEWFTVTGITYTRKPTSVLITLTTNHPFHLWLRETVKKPGKHVKPSYRRGGVLMDDFRICFVEFTDLEQAEPGDTLTHTWLITHWVAPSWHHFYFFGTVASVSSDCVSAIYHYFYDTWVYPTDFDVRLLTWLATRRDLL